MYISVPWGLKVTPGKCQMQVAILFGEKIQGGYSLNSATKLAVSCAPTFATNSLRLCPLSILQLLKHMFPTHMVSPLRAHVTSAVESLLSLSQGKRFFFSYHIFIHTFHLSVASTLLTQGMYLIQKQGVLSFPLTHILRCSLFSSPLAVLNEQSSLTAVHLLCWLVQNIPGQWIFFLFTTSLCWYVKKLATDTVQTWLMAICHNYTLWFTNY